MFAATIARYTHPMNPLDAGTPARMHQEAAEMAAQAQREDRRAE